MRENERRAARRSGVCPPQVPSVYSKDKNKSKQQKENGQSHTTNRQVRWSNEREARVTLFSLSFFFFSSSFSLSFTLTGFSLATYSLFAWMPGWRTAFSPRGLFFFPSGSLCIQGHPITPAAGDADALATATSVNSLSLLIFLPLILPLCISYSLRSTKSKCIREGRRNCEARQDVR